MSAASRRESVRRAVAAYEAAYGAPIAVGATIHVNHEDCSGGTDTRRRLYITRKMTDAGGITDLAYCHNCGQGWAASCSIPNVRSMRAPLISSVTESLDLEELHLVPAGTEGFPEAAREFLAPIMYTGGGIWAEADLENAGIGYNRANGRLVLPIYDALHGTGGRTDTLSGAQLLGWQERRLYGNGPKYITTDNGTPLETMVHLSGHAARAIVFVEDYLSAIRVSQSHPFVAAVPLLRFKVRAERVAELAKSRLPAIVWLDNDTPDVIKEASHLTRLWRALGNKAERVAINDQPKSYATLAEVNSQIEAHMRGVL